MRAGARSGVALGDGRAHNGPCIVTYAEAIQFLYDLQLFGVKLGLENARRLSALAGNPQERLRFIHVAGTNGKGSTCAMLESIYRASGLRVGLFTSPHLVRFGERLQIDRQPIADEHVVRLVTEMRLLMERFPRDYLPTFFEVVTVMALKFFAEQQCELVIWETGLGGRLDATNIVTPLASVITNVQLDHQQFLGNTIPRIAAEKAGIIKPGVPVITGADAIEAIKVIRGAAELAGAPLAEVGPGDTARPPLDMLRLPLMGEHQRLNAAVALSTVQALQGIIPVAAEAIVKGLMQVEWAGRLQVIRSPSGQVTLLDGAHNPAAIEALERALRQNYPGQRPVAILGILRDKDWQAICDMVLPLAKSVCLVPVASARTARPEELRGYCVGRHPSVPLNVCHSLGEALRLTQAEPFRLVTGSLYLVGEALDLLGAIQSTASDERGLNEWQPVRQARG